MGTLISQQRLWWISGVVHEHGMYMYPCKGNQKVEWLGQIYRCIIIIYYTCNSHGIHYIINQHICSIMSECSSLHIHIHAGTLSPDYRYLWVQFTWESKQDISKLCKDWSKNRSKGHLVTIIILPNKRVYVNYTYIILKLQFSRQLIRYGVLAIPVPPIYRTVHAIICAAWY